MRLPSKQGKKQKQKTKTPRHEDRSAMAQTGQTCWEMGEAPSTHPKTLHPNSGVGHLTLF